MNLDLNSVNSTVDKSKYVENKLNDYSFLLNTLFSIIFY
jgi:hypothetical protein